MNASTASPLRASAAIVFLDLQDEIVKNSRTNPPASLGSRAGSLAKLAALHQLPVFASSVGVGGAYLSEIKDALPQFEARPRTSTDAFDDAGLVAALRDSGRRTLIVAGVASEIVVLRTTLAAVAAGYEVRVAVDACGGVSPRTEDATWRRIVQAGGITTSVTSTAAELAGDFTTELGGKTLAIMYETLAG